MTDDQYGVIVLLLVATLTVAVLNFIACAH